MPGVSAVICLTGGYVDYIQCLCYSGSANLGMSRAT